MAHDKLRPPPSDVTGELGAWLGELARIVNRTPNLSYFSGTDANTSAITGRPGDILVNIGSASTWTRGWMMSGSAASISTSGWKMFRMA